MRLGRAGLGSWAGLEPCPAVPGGLLTQPLLLLCNLL